jgi:hypothetical protein
MPRASAQIGYSNRMRADMLRAAQERIGQELKAYYEPPRGLPNDMRMLLMQLSDAADRATDETDSNC